MGFLHEAILMVTEPLHKYRSTSLEVRESGGET